MATKRDILESALDCALVVLTFALLVLCTGCAAPARPLVNHYAELLPPLPPGAEAPQPATALREAAATPPAVATITLLWDAYPDPEATFNVYASPDLEIWRLITNTPSTALRLPLEGPQRFFWLTATNRVGESWKPF
jgi:hypothetical protein